MKKFYSLLAAGALFAGAANAQVELGTNDLGFVPIWIKGMDVDNPQIDAKPGSTLKASFDGDGALVEDQTDFIVAIALAYRDGSDNEIYGTPVATFVDNSFNAGPGFRGFSFGGNVQFDPNASQPYGPWGTDIMIVTTYPNAVVYSEGTPEESRDDGHIADYTLSADSIFKLIDLEDYENFQGSFLEYIAQDPAPFVTKGNFESNKVYGLYYYIVAHATVVDGILDDYVTDTNPENNHIVMPLLWDGTVSVKEMMKEGAKQSVVVYPNPVQDQFYFDHYFAERTENVQINIVDITGKVVHTQKEATPDAAGARYTVKTDKLAAGTYIVQLVTDNYTSTGKFIKK